MKIVIPSEIKSGETRVSIVPETVKRLVKEGLEVFVQKGAGIRSSISDVEYEKSGAKILSDEKKLWNVSNIGMKINSPEISEIDMMPSESCLISFLDPHNEKEIVEHLKKKNITSLAMNLIPRIARAQSMDVLSSMSSLFGYKAILLAASMLPKFFPLMMTAAGTIPPAKGLILGAGVAGLQAIATGRRLGAVMYAFDIRPEVKEQIESLGATFISNVPLTVDSQDNKGYAKQVGESTLQNQRELLKSYFKDMDFVITTALIPGKIAPILIHKDMIDVMKPGSVIIDIAASAGGNCEVTKKDEEVDFNGVKIFGPTNLPATMPIHASQMYSRNMFSFLMNIFKKKDGLLQLDFKDEIVSATCVTHNGEISE